MAIFINVIIDRTYEYFILQAVCSIQFFYFNEKTYGDNTSLIGNKFFMLARD